MLKIISKATIFIKFVSADAVHHVDSIKFYLRTRFQATLSNDLLNTAITPKTTEYFGTALNQMCQILQDRLTWIRSGL